MSGKDAEIERAFERAEKDEEHRQVSGLPVFTVAPIPIWEDPEPCPACGSDQVFKMEFNLEAAGTYWKGSCVDCGWYWPLETDPEAKP